MDERSATIDDSAVVIIGGGPAGLTAAYRLTREGATPVVFEADDVVGGIARTVERDGWRFDIGGHRFFTKVASVEELWFEILPEADWLVRPRTSLILYEGRFYDYPLRALNVFRNLGIVRTLRCIASYAMARLRPPRDQSNFEGWVTARFGRRLYEMFFRTYTEKVWGVPATSIRADWAVQRIRSLSLWSAARDALRIRRRTTNTEVTSLIAEFHYPRLGPGMLWERCRELVEEAGGSVRLRSEVVVVDWASGVGATSVSVHRDGEIERHRCTSVVSSMPLSQLVGALRPPPPEPVATAAAGLRYRDFLVVALVLPAGAAFDAQWIYVHSPGVRVGRVQNFAEWSPEMVRPGTVCLGLEYFVDEGDEVWSTPDDELVRMAAGELQHIGLGVAAAVEVGYVVRMPKAYPIYDEDYEQYVTTIRRWLADQLPNVHPVGRNGMHRYNNQDHSMLTAMLTVENMLEGAAHDVWTVNVEEDYHEDGPARTDPSGRSGTGRAAPILPRGS